MNVILGKTYAHYGGGRYTVLCVAEESTNVRKSDDALVVIYISLTYGKIKCRDLAEFTEPVTWPDGTVRPRFVVEEGVVLP